MNRFLLNHIPSSVLLLLFVVLALLFAWTVFRVVRRYFPDLAGDSQNEIATLSVELIGAVYGIVLGFLIVALWTAFDAASSNVASEATALSQVVRSADAFAPDGRAAVQRAAGAYARAVTDDEWPKMALGESSEQAAEAIAGIYAALRAYEPQTESQKTFYREAVDHTNDVLRYRRMRLDEVDSTIPGSLQVMTYGGFVAIVGFMAIVGSTRRRLQLLLLLGVTAVLAFNLALMTTLDYPFSGDISVSSEPFTAGALAQFFAR